MRPFYRYLLFQIPTWMVVSAVALALYSSFGVSPHIAVVMVLLVVASDFLLYPFFRHSWAARPQTGLESLIGETAVVIKTLDPQGYVKARGERWKARSSDGEGPLEVHTRVRIEASSGLMLFVRKCDES